MVTFFQLKTCCLSVNIIRNVKREGKTVSWGLWQLWQSKGKGLLAQILNWAPPFMITQGMPLVKRGCSRAESMLGHRRREPPCVRTEGRGGWAASHLQVWNIWDFPKYTTINIIAQKLTSMYTLSSLKAFHIQELIVTSQEPSSDHFIQVLQMRKKKSVGWVINCWEFDG